MKEDFAFYLLETVLFLLFSIHSAIVYIKRRTKYNLSMLLILVIILVGTILSYFYQENWFPGIGMGIQISLIVIFVIAVWIFLFYPEIKRFFSQRKTRKK